MAGQRTGTGSPPSMSTPDSLAQGDTGPLVVDLRIRLRSLGFDTPGHDDAFDETTAGALRSFQASRGLDPDAFCGPQTWLALTEASFHLGSRLLCLTAPMTRGDDVAELQLRLGSLGFDAGRTDGIFGPNTQRALGEFQRNVGLVADLVCGPNTVEHLLRLATRGSNISVAGLREREELHARRERLIGLRIALCHHEGDELLAGRAGSELQRAGATAAAMTGADWSTIATAVNEFNADVCIAISPSSSACCEVSYFSTEGFESAGGARLARLLVAEIPSDPHRPPAVVVPMRHPILRETRCPTVRWKVGDDVVISETSALLVAAIERAVRRWVAEPG